VAPFGSAVGEIEFGISAALSKDAEYQPGRTGVLRIANLTGDGELDLRDVRYLPISYKKRNQLMLREGDLLFNWRNSPNWIGKTAIVNGDLDCIFASFLYRFRARPDVADTQYVWFYLNHLRAKGVFEAMCRQAVSQANLGRDELASVQVMLPPLDMQQRFASKITDIKSLRRQQSAATTKAKAAFDALLAQAFSTSEATA
jgi:type I restriction enzyme S subunit